MSTRGLTASEHQDIGGRSSSPGRRFRRLHGLYLFIFELVFNGQRHVLLFCFLFVFCFLSFLCYISFFVTNFSSSSPLQVDRRRGFPA